MISKDTARKVLSAALKTGADLAEVYVEDHTSLSLEMDESRLEKAIRGADRGAGVRVFFGNLVTYAFTDNLSEESLLQAAAAASAAAKGSSKNRRLTIKITQTDRWRANIRSNRVACVMVIGKF